MSQSYVTHTEQCPECAKRGRDTRRNNLAVYSDGHKFCFSCRYFVPGDRIKTIKDQLYGTPASGPEHVVLPEDVSPYPTPEALDWFYSFGFNYGDVVRNRMLWSDYYNRLIFPIYSSGNELVAWQGRYFGKEQRPKWLSKGAIHEVIYTKGLSSPAIVLVEDIVSCLKLEKAKIYSGCLFGSNPNKATLNRFKLVANHLIFWLDDDKKIESVKFKRTCESMGIPSSCIFTTSDPKEYSEHQIRQFVLGDK